MLQLFGCTHPEGKGGQTALIYDSPVTDTIEKYTFDELRSENSLPSVLSNDQSLQAKSHGSRRGSC